MSNKIYFTPGPAQLFYTIQDHIKSAIFHDIGSISHRSAEFTKVVKETQENLKVLLELPDGYDVFFINSANEAWDRIIQNLVISQSHHFVNGAFSEKFYDFSKIQGMTSSKTESSKGNTFSNFEVPETAELIGITKNETSVGYSFTEKEIETLRLSNPHKLIALDVVSATPSVPVNFSNIDTAYFSVQKCFGMPPGLGVWIANEQCQDKAKQKAKNSTIGSYRSLANLKKFGAKNQTPETPNTIYIYLLGKIVKDMLDVGIKKLRNDTTYKAVILNQMVKDHPDLSHFVDSEVHRSKTTIVAKSVKANDIIEKIAKKGLILGNGYGEFKDDHVRIANFPTHSKESVEMLCDLLMK
ncbi:MAG: aminotransferase class V-fold PLP-dependent enzyme [Ekhidna sp.]